MKNLEMSDLVGKKVLSATVNSEKDYVKLETDNGAYYLTWNGDCCSRCYIASASGTDALIDATILEVRDDEWKTIKDSDLEVINSMGTTIKTDRGYVTLETRLEHNGYYSGRIDVSKEGPVDQYNDLDEDRDEYGMKPLKDFL